MVTEGNPMAMTPSPAAATTTGATSSGGDYVDLHELSKGWKAAIARAKDPATRYVLYIFIYSVERVTICCTNTLIQLYNPLSR